MLPYLLSIKTRTLVPTTEEETIVFEGQPQTMRRESDHEDCRISHQVFGMTRISQGARKDRFAPGKRWRGTSNEKDKPGPNIVPLL